LDETKEKELTQLRDKIKKDGHFGRMYRISDPKWLIFIAVIFSIGIGGS
jgi:hypothetical protein